MTHRVLAVESIALFAYFMKTNKYLVTIEFPAPDNCYRGEVMFEEVEATSEEEAEQKAKTVASRWIKVNRVQNLGGSNSANTSP
jgi:hypothetical protein